VAQRPEPWRGAVTGDHAAAVHRRGVPTMNPLVALYKIAVLTARAALLLLAFLLLPVMLLFSGKK